MYSSKCAQTCTTAVSETKGAGISEVDPKSFLSNFWGPLQALHGLVVYDKTPVVHFCGDTPIAITAFMLMENRLYTLFLHGVFVTGFQAFQVIIEHGTGHLPQLQQQVKGVFRP